VVITLLQEMVADVSLLVIVYQQEEEMVEHLYVAEIDQQQAQATALQYQVVHVMVEVTTTDLPVRDQDLV